MAQVPDSAGVQQVEPDTRLPDDYQHIQANPDQFGGLIARGEEKAGAGLTEASTNLFNVVDFQGKVNTDDQVNKWVEGNNKILYGDPNKPAVGPDGTPVMGPDGKPQPDRGFMGLDGRAAADKRDETLKALEDQRLAGRKNLTAPKDQLLYDEQTRRMYALAEREIGQHVDTQWKVWAGGVNGSGAKLSLDGIAANPDNAESVAHNASDLINFRVQEAQIKFGDEPQIKTAAIVAAKQEALKAQTEAIAVKDPARALAMVEKNKTIAGTIYDELANKFRARADMQTGIGAGTAAIKSTYEVVPPTGNVLPVLDSVGQRYGISGSYLLRTHQLEGDGISSTGAKGPYQFTDKTGAQYGLKNPYDFGASAEAAAKLAADNKVQLTNSLGHSPTDAELYLSHQQGAGGAAKLLQNPNVRAGDLLPAYRTRDGKLVDPIKDNGGDPNAPASTFTGMWTAKFNGAAGAMSHARKASAYQTIASDPDLSDAARAHAFQYVSQTIAAQQIAEESDIKAKAMAKDQAIGEYLHEARTGDPKAVIAKIWSDARLTGESPMLLENAITSKLGIEDPIQFGDKYTDTYQRIFADASDPGKITNVDQILQMGMPGAGLTPRGVDRLTKGFGESRNQKLGEHDQNGVNTAKVSLLKAIESKYARTQMIPGMGPVSMNLKGQQICNEKFVPRFEAEYDAYMHSKNNANPYYFWNEKKTNEIADQVYPRAHPAADSISGSGEAGINRANAPIPEPPDGVDKAAWQSVNAKPPKMATGLIADHEQYGEAIKLLLSSPTPQAMASFDKWFGTPGAGAKDIIGKLKPAGAPAP